MLLNSLSNTSFVNSKTVLCLDVKPDALAILTAVNVLSPVNIHKFIPAYRRDVKVSEILSYNSSSTADTH